MTACRATREFVRGLHESQPLSVLERVVLGAMVLLLACFCAGAQLDFAVIHTVTATIAPMPKIQMNRPSDTGPSEPSEKPPGDAVLLQEQQGR